MNGAPEFRPYTYRGTGQDTLTAWMDSRSYTPRGPSAGMILKPCGTVAAYKRHRRRGEMACPACAEASRLDTAARAAARAMREAA